MRVIIEKSEPQGCVNAPPSKSMAHRLIILAALSKGKSVIKNISLSDDISATLNCIKAIGADYTYENDILTVFGTKEVIINDVLRCNECGSTLRFFIPVCMLSGDECVLTGSKKLLSRPLGVYEDICEKNSIAFFNDGEKIIIKGMLKSGKFAVPGNISSQFITGLLLVLPLFEGDSVLEITGKTESRPYIDMTVAAQKLFGAKIVWKNENTLFIPGGQSYIPCEAENEGDWSNAAFLFALGANVKGVKQNSLQGDKTCKDYFTALKKGYCDIDISDCPDLGPILFAFAALNCGGRFTGTRRLKIKESDRAAAMAEELKKFGVKALVSDNEVMIPKSVLASPKEPLYGHNDHRIVMSLGVMCAYTGGVIDGAQVVNKSYPGFFEDLRKLKVIIRYEA